jgi:hypothetical protein
MITLKIDKWEEPKPTYTVYTSPANTNYSTSTKTTFNDEEIETARKISAELGILPGVELVHTPTAHKVLILGFVPKDKIIGYKGNPMILKARRTRDNYDWDTTFSVEELLETDFTVVNTGTPF